VVLSLPFLLLVLIIVSFFGIRDIRVIVFAIAFAGWTTAARLVRAEFLQLRETDFVAAAKALGAPVNRIIVRHMLPGAMAPLVVAMSLGVADAIIGESALSFLGFGIAPPEVSLGQMLQNYREYFYSNSERILYPGLVLVAIVMCASFLGDGLRDALDPRQRVES
jgi:peptide/nickel transport system permease protein